MDQIQLLATPCPITSQRPYHRKISIATYICGCQTRLQHHSKTQDGFLESHNLNISLFVAFVFNNNTPTPIKTQHLPSYPQTHLATTIYLRQSYQPGPVVGRILISLRQLTMCEARWVVPVRPCLSEVISTNFERNLTFAINQQNSSFHNYELEKSRKLSFCKTQLSPVHSNTKYEAPKQHRLAISLRLYSNKYFALKIKP